MRYIFELTFADFCYYITDTGFDRGRLSIAIASTSLNNVYHSAHTSEKRVAVRGLMGRFIRKVGEDEIAWKHAKAFIERII
jgi:hypothetical protein